MLKQGSSAGRRHLPDPFDGPPADTSAGSMATQLAIPIIPRPGAAFEHRGRFVYIATETQAVLQLDEEAYVILASLLGGWTFAECQANLSLRGVSSTQDQIAEHVRKWSKAGLLRGPDMAWVRPDVQRSIDTLLAHQPMKMMLFMAESCNLRCTYCYGIEGNYEDRGEKMSPRTAEAAVDYLLANSPDREHFYLYFFGGEPLLNLACIRHTVAYAKSQVTQLGKTVEFGITTNGTLLTEAACALLVDEDFQVVVSMDGAPGDHDVNRPTKSGGGSHRHVVRGLGRLMKLSSREGQVKIRATMSHQAHSPTRIIDYFESAGIEHYGIGSSMERVGSSNLTDVKAEDLVEMEAEYEGLLDDILERLALGHPLPHYNPFFRALGSMTEGGLRPIIGCGLCRNDQGIGADGKIYPCHRYVGLENYVIGNVTDGLNREAVRSVYQGFFDMWDRHCRKCWARYTCSGSCAWQHSHDDGSIKNPIAEQCHSIRQSIAKTSWLALEFSQEHPELFASLQRSPVVAGACGCSSPA